MRKKFLKSTMSIIKKKYPDYNEEKLEVIEYGLETLYIMVSKTIVISLIALFLGVFKEMLIITIFYNIIRTTAFGMHAKESWQCYIISITLFIGGALLYKYVNVNFYIKAVVSAVAYIFLVIYVKYVYQKNLQYLVLTNILFPLQLEHYFSDLMLHFYYL